MGQIPHFKSSDASLLKIAEPFGKVRRYFLNRSRNEVMKCFVLSSATELSWNEWETIEIQICFVC